MTMTENKTHLRRCNSKTPVMPLSKMSTTSKWWLVHTHTHTHTHSLATPTRAHDPIMKYTAHLVTVVMRAVRKRSAIRCTAKLYCVLKKHCANTTLNNSAAYKKKYHLIFLINNLFNIIFNIL